MGRWADWHREMGVRWLPRDKGWDSRSCSNRKMYHQYPLAGGRAVVSGTGHPQKEAKAEGCLSALSVSPQTPTCHYLVAALNDVLPAWHQMEQGARCGVNASSPNGFGIPGKSPMFPRPISSSIKNGQKDFPGGTVDKKSACQCRGHGFDPWSGKIPHAAEQPSPRTTTPEPARRN